jgi:hypothetical protein
MRESLSQVRGRMSEHGKEITPPTPWPAIPPAMEQSTDMARTKREELTFVTSELNESCNAETAGMIASDARPATVRVICTNEELMIAHSVLRSCEAILAD